MTLIKLAFLYSTACVASSIATNTNNTNHLLHLLS